MKTINAIESELKLALEEHHKLSRRLMAVEALLTDLQHEVIRHKHSNRDKNPMLSLVQ